MLDNLLSHVWAMEPTRFHVWKGFLQDVILPQVMQGPVEDAARQGMPIESIGNTAIINLKGVIVRNAGVYGQYFGLASTDHVARAMKMALADDSIEQIVLFIGSPGGSVDGLAECGDIIAEVNRVKPITAQVSGMMASAALYLGSQATSIYAGRMDLVGSIGTKMMLYDYSEFFEKKGVKAIPVDTGEHKSAGAYGTKITEAQIAQFQRIVDGYNEDFLTMVQNGRRMNRKELDTLADGRVFFASEAVENGLIDGIRTFDETMAELKPKATTARYHNQLNRLRLETLS